MIEYLSDISSDDIFEGNESGVFRSEEIRNCETGEKVLNMEPTIDEIRSVLKTFKNGYAVGGHKIPIEFTENAVRKLSHSCTD